MITLKKDAKAIREVINALRKIAHWPEDLKNRVVLESYRALNDLLPENEKVKFNEPVSKTEVKVQS